MLVRRLPSLSCLLAFALCACHRPPEPPAAKGTPQPSASAAQTPTQTPAPPKSLHERIDDFQNRVPPHPPPDNAQMAASSDFDALALKYSDDPKAKADHGKLGKIGQNQLDKAFTEYAFALMKFETGPIPLDTPAGFEIIRRME